jgi:hypothetical protein
VIRQTADNLPKATVEERLRDALAQSGGQAPGFRVLLWAGADGNIGDNPEPTIALLDPTRFALTLENGGGAGGHDRLETLFDKIGGGRRQWRNSLILVAPDVELWLKAEEAVREVMAYESVLDQASKATVDLSPNERKDLGSRLKDKRESLRTSLVTAYRHVFYPGDSGLSMVSLPVPATKDETIVGRTVARLSDQDYGHPKIMERISAVFFNSRIAPQLWKDESAPLDLEEAGRRFRQWTYLPILPRKDDTLRACIREGLSQGLWAVAIGDNATSKYTQLIEEPEQLDGLQTVFDGSAYLVKGDLLVLIREELGLASPGRSQPQADFEQEAKPGAPGAIRDRPPTIPPPARRFTRVRLRIHKLAISKTSNLQPYLFRVLQEQDPGSELSLEISVSSTAGIPEDVLQRRIVEGLEQLGIEADFEGH